MKKPRSKPKKKPTETRHASFRLTIDVLDLLTAASARSTLSKTKVLELVLRKELPRFAPASQRPDPTQLAMFE